MQVVYNSEDLSAILRESKIHSKRVGFVPTMGALHNGHLSLIEASNASNDITICSIFVNPLQFNNAQDLQHYPRTLEADISMLQTVGCDVLFVPDASQMYPASPKIRIDFGNLETVMEGRFRPGHFNGVAIVVAKLFHLVDPDYAYFGQKDLQQFLIIQQMVKDLSFRVKLVCCEIVREADGLAMSSRNRRLQPAHRSVAPKLHEALQLAQRSLINHSPDEVKKIVTHFLSQEPLIQLEYLEIADGVTLETVGALENHEQVAICIAAYLGEIRLIDNVVFSPGKKVPGPDETPKTCKEMN